MNTRKKIYNINSSPTYYGAAVPEYTWGGALSGAAAGASVGTMIFPVIGTAIGAGLGAIGGAIFGNKTKQKKQGLFNLQRKQEKAQQDKIDQAAQTETLANYDTYGTPDVDFYARGGNIIPAQYEVEGEEVVQGDALLEGAETLASDLSKVVGPSHEQGGVLGAGGERVFSKRLKLPKDSPGILSKTGVKISKDTSYADVAAKLGKQKGKLEKKLNSGFGPANKTAELMLPRIESSLDNLFLDQELSKLDKPSRKIDQFANGGPISPALTGFNRQASFGNLNRTDQVKHVNLLGNSSKGGNAIQTGFGSGFDYGALAGQLGNLGAYVSNLESIKDLDTNVKVHEIPTPVYNYVDRSGTANREIGRQVRAASNALGSSSRTVTGANQAALIAAGMQATNQNQAAENLRKDQYNRTYNDQVWRTNVANAEMYNQANNARRQLINEKEVYLPQQARTAFMQGIQGNEAVRQQRNNDRNRLRISALLNNNNGVLSRAAKDLGYLNEAELLDAILKGR